MSDTIKGRGRHEPNKPRVSNELFKKEFCKIISDFCKEVCHIDSSSANLSTYLNFEASLSLYKHLLLLAPALVIQTGLPMSIYGFGSWKPTKSKSNKRKLKFKISPSITEYINNGLMASGRIEDILKDLMNIGKSEDTSLEEASNES